MTPSRADLTVDPDLIRKYDLSGPRYTSYPTTDRFVGAHGADAHCDWLARRLASSATQHRPLSLYVHLPFCATICFFCCCHKVAAHHRSASTRYLQYLAHEIALTAAALRGARKVAQLQLGGGTPTFLSSTELRTLMTTLARHFELEPGEYAIEVDPRGVDTGKIQTLAQLGFNRISVGVQDFDPAVQTAINRTQSAAETSAVIDCARANGIASVDIDLIVGLPLQNLIGLGRTIEQVIAIRPDRIALYRYLHAPQNFNAQRHIVEAQLPSTAQSLHLLGLATRRLIDAGYVYIGLDHFALPYDSIAVAARQGRLHRNFQGYSAHPDGDLLGFGVSAISKVGASYCQNVRSLDDYYDHLDRDQLPVQHGIELNADDLLRRAVISSLMCRFELSIEAIEIAYLVNFRQYFSAEWPQLLALQRDGLIEIEEAWVSVTARGRFLAAAVAAVFDRYLQHDRRRAQLSNAI